MVRSPRFFSTEKTGNEHGHISTSFERLAVFCKVNFDCGFAQFVVFLYDLKWWRSPRWLLPLVYIYFAAFLS